MFAYGDEVTSQLQDALTDLKGSSESPFAGLDALLKDVSTLVDSLPVDKSAAMRQFADVVTTKPLDAGPENTIRTALMLGQEVTIPSWVPNERTDHVHQLLANVTSDQVDMRFHTTDEPDNRQWVTRQDISGVCRLLEGVSDDDVDMQFHTTDEQRAPRWVTKDDIDNMDASFSTT